MEVYESDFDASTFKDDHSPLTEADLRSNEILVKGLNDLSVSFPIVSEEMMNYSTEERMGFETFWLIDPLDGTKEFINKNGEFAICIALIHHQKSVFGMVYAPVLNQLYYAVESKGAFEEIDSNDVPLKCAEIDWTSQGLRLGVSRSHKNQAVTDFVERFRNPVLISKGSVLKMTEIAKGNMDIYPRLDSYTSEWDIAAGQIIVEEAGGSVLMIENDEPLIYNKVSLKNPPFIVSAKQI